MAIQSDRRLVPDLAAMERVVEVDMDRKEELILAKQLRACRVSILPRVWTDTMDSLAPWPATAPSVRSSPSSSSSAAPSTRSSPVSPSSAMPPSHIFRQQRVEWEPDPTNLDHLKILDPANPPWTSEAREQMSSSPGPETQSAPELPPKTRCNHGSIAQEAVTVVPDIRLRMRPWVNSPPSSAPSDSIPSVVSNASCLQASSPCAAPSLPAFSPTIPPQTSSMSAYSSTNSLLQTRPICQGSICNPVPAHQNQVSNHNFNTIPRHAPGGGSSKHSSDHHASSSSISQPPPPAIRISSFEEDDSCHQKTGPESGNPVGSISSSVLHTNPTIPPAAASSSHGLSPTSGVSRPERPGGASTNHFTKRPHLPFLAEIRALQTAVGGARNRDAVDNPAASGDSSARPAAVTQSVPFSAQKAKSPAPIGGNLEGLPAIIHPLPLATIIAQPVLPASLNGHENPPDLNFQRAPAAANPLPSVPLDGADQSTAPRVGTAPTAGAAAEKSRRRGTTSPASRGKTVQFELPTAAAAAAQKDQSLCKKETAATAEPQRPRKSGLKLTERSNMASLADMILPQLNEMQKNYLGLLFFNELSQHIVDEIVAQQVSMMSGSKLASTLAFASPQASDTAATVLMQRARPQTRAALVVDSLCAMNADETAETLLNIAGHESINIVVSMCEMAGPQFKRSLLQTLLAQEEDDEEPDLVFKDKIAPNASSGSLIYSPPASSSEEGYASATISPSGENVNNDEDE